MPILKKPEFLKIKTRATEIWLDDQNILHVNWLDTSNVELQDVKDCFEAYKQLGVGPTKKALQVMEGDFNFFSFSAEAKSYAAKVGPGYFIASSIISDSLAIRILVNSFNIIYNHTVPFKMFRTKEEAIKWLLRKNGY